MTIRLIFICGALLATGTLLVAQSRQASSSPGLRDPNGRWEITNISSLLLDAVKRPRITFEASGQPLRGSSRAQNLTFSAQSATGAFVEERGGGLRLIEALLTGNVRMEVTGKDRSGEPTRSDIQTASAELKANANSGTITLPDSFTFVNQATTQGKNRSGSRNFQIEGRGGIFELKGEARGTQEITSATIRGPVRLTLDSTTLVEGADGSSEREDTKIIATGNSLTYTASTGTFLMTGNIKIDGDRQSGQAGYLGSLTGERLEIKVDKSFDVISMRLSAGQATVEQKPTKETPKR
ncbi:MAG: hypothetical protein MUC92_03565 [Fimbriimonadaceae bacterium]|jgi:hypothetical protein|nr:hypothetical protein [Fimbriimonadaceae bacterium]